MRAPVSGHASWRSHSGVRQQQPLIGWSYGSLTVFNKLGSFACKGNAKAFVSLIRVTFDLAAVAFLSNNCCGNRNESILEFSRMLSFLFKEVTVF